MTRDPKAVTERAIGIGGLILAIAVPVVFNAYWVDVILTQALIVGIAAASLIFLAAYGGMVSLAQTMLMGAAGFMIGNMVTKGGTGGETKGLLLGWDPTLALFLALLGTTLLGLLLGALSARSTGIYFLMITLTYSVVGYYFVSQVTVVSGFSGIGSVNEYTPPFVGDIVHDRNRLYYIALGVSIVAYLVIRFLIPDAVRPCVARGPRRARADVARSATPLQSIGRSRSASRRFWPHSQGCCSCGGRGRSRPATSACRRLSTFWSSP